MYTDSIAGPASYFKVSVLSIHASIERLSYRLILIWVHAVLWLSCCCREISLVAGGADEDSDDAEKRSSPCLLTCHGATLRLQTHPQTYTYTLIHTFLHKLKGRERESSAMLALPELHCMTCPPIMLLRCTTRDTAADITPTMHVHTHTHTTIQLMFPEGLGKAP